MTTTTEKRLPILAVDTDGVINSYKSGWQGAHVMPDPPVPGAMAFLKEATNHFDVHIVSSRLHQKTGLFAVQDYIEFWASHEDPALLLSADPWVKKLKYTPTRPSAFVTLDDRGWQFNGTFPTMEELLAFKPWWKD